MKALQVKPQKVKDLASEKTLIFDPTSAPKVEVPKVETPATILSTSTESGAAKTAQAEQAVNNKKASRVRHTLLRRVDNETFNTWNQEKELTWIKKVLPQLSDNDRVRVVKGLIRVANSGAYAWGQFNNGIITLSDIAAEGTTYHEAFHAVFNLLLDQNERTSLLNEYREKHPNMDNLSLEEELAEDFREFVIQGGKDTRSLGRKIIDFFKSLFIKTKYWKDFRPSSIYYFRAINEGKYSKGNIPITTLGDSRYKQEEYTQEMKDILAKAPRDSQGRLLAPNRKLSNLTERQYAQVRTKAFKEWFGDWENDPANASKVVDENGEPMVMTHNTTANPFYVFNTEKSLGKASYFANALAIENGEVGGFVKGNTNISTFLNIRNPYESIEFTDFDDAREGGYDGAIISGDGMMVAAAFSPNQIKSATDNIGTFDANNPDIRYRESAITPKDIQQYHRERLDYSNLDSTQKALLEDRGINEEHYSFLTQAEKENLRKCLV